MRPATIAKMVCVVAAFAASITARAEDIDLFSGQNNLALPNLIIILDNTGNWGSSFPRPNSPINCGSSSNQSTRYCAAKTALYNAVNSLDVSAGAKINVGLMLFNYNNGKANTGVAPTTLKTGNNDG